MAERKKTTTGGGDAPDKKKDDKAKGKGKPEEPPEPEEVHKTPSQIAREEAEYRAMLRKQRFKRKWPEITRPEIKTRPWHPPPPPRRLPPIVIPRPELTLRRWVPPYRRRRRRRPRLLRVPPDQITQPLYECSKLRKIWHNFVQVEKNKMILQGSVGCNSKKYSSTACGSQTACIAVACRALLEETPPARLTRADADRAVAAGDRYYRQCALALKCYKGKPQLQLNQLLTSFYLGDTRYTVKLSEVDRGLLAKHPDNIQPQQDLMALMEKRAGTTYMLILSAGDRHFLVWGHPPPPEAASAVRTVCYMFDPHMLNELGQPDKLRGAAAFLRYAGITSFVLDFLANYGDLESAKRGAPRPALTLTEVEVVQREPLAREPTYELDLKALRTHCRSEWDSIYINALIEKKIKEGKYPQCSLSAVSLATSRATSRKKVRDFYQKTPKEPAPQLPMPPERPPPALTQDQIMSMRGEGFFLYCPRGDGHAYGRDDMIPRPKSETVLHSPVEVADKNFHSQYAALEGGRWVLRGTRHMASARYQVFKTFTAVPCCVAALATLRRLRARAWCEDTVDETLDLGFNIYRESLVERGGPIRRLVLGELKENFRIRDQEYVHKERGIAVWGKMVSADPKVFDLCRGIEQFFKESDSGLLQIPGEIEMAIWHEGGHYYLYHPWPADARGRRVGLQGGGRACVLRCASAPALCHHLLDSLPELRRKPFSIADVAVWDRRDLPDPVNKLKPVAPDRWVVRGHFHEGDARFPEASRGKQATPAAVAAIALAHVRAPTDFTPDDIDDILVRGDELYQNTMEHLEKLGINLEMLNTEEEAGEEEERGASGTLAAADVLTRFRVTDYDCVETDVQDCAYTGMLTAEPGSGVLSLKDSLRQMFKEYSHAVVTCRGGSVAIWRHDDSYYMFDPHGCDERGFPSDEPRAAACLVRVRGGPDALAAAVLAAAPPGADDSFNVSPVGVTATRLRPDLGAPETKLESKAFEWISKGTAAVLMGPRGENSAIGKAAERAGIGEEDMAGRALALPAAAAFVASTGAVPPPYMHQDHMYNFLEAGADYYLQHVKRTGRRDIAPEDLSEKFELGANTFTLELGEPVRLPLRLPDAPAPEGGEEEGGDQDETGEELEEEQKEEPMKQIRDALFKQWYDTSAPSWASLLVGDYHQLGVWLAPGGRVLAFDAAPTLAKGQLTAQRIQKGDELRLQRIKDEMAGEGGDEPEEGDEEAGGEGEEQPEPEPQYVPPESCPVLMVFSTPQELVDKLAMQGRLDPKQCLAPYKLYPVTVRNELTSALRERKPPASKPADEEGAAGDEEEEEALIDPLEDEALGAGFMRLGRAAASLRGRVAQSEAYFLDPNRDNQDAANAVMGIVVDHIEPYTYWKPELVDAILKYGDRLYTASLPRAAAPPTLCPREVAKEFHVTTFNVRLEMEEDAVVGDLKAGDSGAVLNLRRALARFFETYKHGVLCAKDYCVGVWRAADDRAFVLWEPHAVGPAGRASPGGAATAVLLSTVDQLADTFRDNVADLARPGSNKFSITAVKVFWELSKAPGAVTAQGAVPDEGYEWKVLTGYVETARGRTILRGSRPPDAVRFARDALLQSACGAVAAACMAHVRRPPLWSRRTVDEVLAAGRALFAASLQALGYEFRPGEDVLLPLQVLKRFVLGVNYVRFDLQQVFAGKLEQRTPTEMTVRCALERFFEAHTHGILWSVPHAVAVWRVAGSPPFYMMEPHACGPTGLRVDAHDDGAACVLTFTSAKLMAFAYLQNVPVTERPKHDFQLYAISVNVQPIKKLGGVDPPLVRAPPGVNLVPATSKVGVDGRRRRADEAERKHPPGGATCRDAQRAADARDRDDAKLKGQRNTSGWLVLSDGSQFLSAHHSLACRRYAAGARGLQALPAAVVAVAGARVQDVCRWCSSTLDQLLDAGDQLYQDSYLHYRPKNKILSIQQVLRKFYTPGNCVCRVVVYRPRQRGIVDTDLFEKLSEFFREEKCGVLVAGRGDFAVALFRTPRGYYMFDPLDRDRYGRAVPPPCRGRARACFSQYPNVQSLAEKLGPNIPPVLRAGDDADSKQVRVVSARSGGQLTRAQSGEDVKEVHFEEPASFAIYGMEVTSLRRLNQFEQ